MARYASTGKTSALTATVDHCVAEVWNPSSTKRIKVLQLHVVATAATAGELGIKRTSAKGTAASTITPVANNEYESIAAPVSAHTLELGAFSVQPTLKTQPYMHSWETAAAIGSGVMWVFDQEVEIPAGEGLAICCPTAVAYPAARVTAIVED